MSKSSLITLNSEIERNKRTINSVQKDLIEIDKELFSAMNDSVGDSARESIDSINKNYTYMMNNGYEKIKESLDCLQINYNQLDTFMTEAKKILRDAQIQIKELGDLKL